jgi:adenosylhomocysteinase
MAVETAEMRNNIMGYRLENGNWIYILAEGRLVNLAAGDGHPAEIMDMSFAIQALSAEYLVKNAGNIKEKLIKVPEEVDRAVAFRKLKYLGKNIDTLTPEQVAYLSQGL